MFFIIINFTSGGFNSVGKSSAYAFNVLNVINVGPENILKSAEIILEKKGAVNPDPFNT